MVGEATGRPDPEKAPFVRTEVLQICPDCTWPPGDFSKIIVRTSISGLFFAKKIPGSDPAVSKKLNFCLDWLLAFLQNFHKIRPDSSQASHYPGSSTRQCQKNIFRGFYNWEVLAAAVDIPMTRRPLRPLLFGIRLTRARVIVNVAADSMDSGGFGQVEYRN